tara:strand:- start:220 stop:1005 length:786 start_codon:yes stop_codon:yes gene_type:complete
MKNSLLKLWQEGKPVVNGWLSIPNSFTAEAMSKMGWDSLTIDLQHGQNDYSTSIAMLQGISNGTATPLARVPWNEAGIIMKILDIGALGIIAPMINTKEECERFVSYCYYPPKGQRSFGPMRAQLTYGDEYFAQANENIITMAMIETEQAVSNLDAIMSVPELTGVYIGPADMSISYGMQPKFDVKENPVYSKIQLVAETAKKHNKIAGIHNGSVSYSKEMIDIGFKFITIGSEFRFMSMHAKNIIDEMKNLDSDNQEGTY